MFCVFFCFVFFVLFLFKIDYGTFQWWLKLFLGILAAYGVCVCVYVCVIRAGGSEEYRLLLPCSTPPVIGQ